MTIEATLNDMARAARNAAHKLGRVSSEQKNSALYAIASGLEKEADFIQAENKKDLLRAEEMGLSGAMIDRLTIKAATIDAMIGGTIIPLPGIPDLEKPIIRAHSMEIIH